MSSHKQIMILKNGAVPRRRFAAAPSYSSICTSGVSRSDRFGFDYGAEMYSTQNWKKVNHQPQMNPPVGRNCKRKNRCGTRS